MDGKNVFAGDHTKTVKDARRMPQVETLHQDSETQSKPTFFRGHHWACVGLILKAGKIFFCAPLEAEIHGERLRESRATRIVNMAGEIVNSAGFPAYLVLDAFFAAGTVFKTAANYGGSLHIITRAKKNITAHCDPPPRKSASRGRPKIYGEQLKLMNLFDSSEVKFDAVAAIVYRQSEAIRCLVLDLFWKPAKRKLRFLLVESSHGRIILMTSDLAMTVEDAIALYSRRVTIESLFNVLKNVLGGMKYHFWSKYLTPASRRPTKNKSQKQISSKPQKTEFTLAAIEKFVAVQLVALGSLQLLACLYGSEILASARCWLRTPSPDIQSEFVTRNAVANLIRDNLCGFRKDWITNIILDKNPAIEKTQGICDDIGEAA